MMKNGRLSSPESRLDAMVSSFAVTLKVGLRGLSMTEITAGQQMND